MAGLLAARVLADHFSSVVVVERDRLPNEFVPRKGVPQGRHVHGLLAKGQEILQQLFPGLVEELIADGAVPGDIALDTRWFHYGGYKTRFESGLRGILLSRPLIEGHVRRRVAARENITLLEECDASALAASEDRARVTGVVVRRFGETASETLPGELVVDAGGRGSRAAAWLEALGYARAPEEEIKIGVGYTSRLLRRRADHLPDAKAAIIAATPPNERRLGVLFPIEGERWMVTLGGWLGDHAPPEPSGFADFARSLPAPDVYDVLKDAEPLSEFAVHKFPSNLRRRYERVARVPDGYVVTGDALCSFNPIYGQGMTVAALEALALDACVRADRARLAGLPRRFYKRVSKVIDIAWQSAAGADFAYPAVEGVKPPGTDVINRYVDRVQRAVLRDATVHLAFLDVMNLTKAPTSLFHPRVLWRVLRAHRAVDAPAAGRRGSA
jgi:2-polyprenyl-6-methoxyphenol hydroxylase-like FAD-dependent oxidoreductase